MTMKAVETARTTRRMENRMTYRRKADSVPPSEPGP
jgi:hypothetical protein